MSVFSRGKHDRRRVPVPAERPRLCPENTMPIPGLVLPTETPAYSHSARPRHAKPVAPMNYGPIPLPRPYVPQPGTSQPSASLIPVSAPQRLVALTGQKIPAALYPDPASDPGPAEYSKLMRRVSAATGTASTYENPRAWATRALTAGGTA